MSKASAHANTFSESVPVCAWIDTGVMKTCSGYCYRPVTTREEVACTQHTLTFWVVRIFFFISPTQIIHKVHSSIMFANFFSFIGSGEHLRTSETITLCSSADKQTDKRKTMLPQCKSRKRREGVRGLFRDYMMITEPLLFHNSSLDFNQSSPAEDG